MYKNKRTLKALSVLFALSFICFVLLTPVNIQAQTGDYGGAQFLSKLYTELLGKAPDPAGYDYWATNLTNQGTSRGNLEALANAFVNCQEYANAGLTTRAKVMTIYRALLNRDPDTTGSSYYEGLINGGTPLTTIVNMFINCGEFSALLPAIQNQGPYYWNGSNSGFSVSGTTITASQLQSMLNGAQTIIELAPGTLVTCDTTITIPAGKTLRTGNGASTHYSLKARLLRTADYNAPIVILNNNSTLQNIWVDGNRIAYNNSSNVNSPFALNVSVRGNDCHVKYCRISDPVGGTNLRTEDCVTQDFVPVQRAQVTYNLITGYATSHYVNGQGHAQWADGITVAGRDHDILNNQIVDTTDVGIVLFRYYDNSTRQPSLDQNTRIKYNQITNLGNSAFGGFGVDCWESEVAEGVLWPFNGAQINNNVMWTSSRAHMNIALSIASRAWHYTGANGTGLQAMNNSTPANLYVRTACGIGVDGMLNATVTGNGMSILLGSWQNPLFLSRNMLVNFGPDASGTFQAGYTVGPMHSSTQPYIINDSPSNP